MWYETGEGKAIIFTAPSGAGKTTVVKHLLEQYDTLAFSISATTRTKRSYEQEGEDYYFMDKVTFQQKIAEGAFLEWEEVYPGKFYGTLTSEVNRVWKLGKHLIFDVDVKGAISIKKYFGHRSVAVFIEPPSLETLINRLKNRGTESSETLNQRINRIKNELTYAFQFDKIIVNDILEVTLKEAEMIVEEFI